MLKRTATFIHRLRTYFLMLIIIGFFALAGLNPLDVGYFAGARIGQAVGMSISVPENPFNRLALDLKNKEERLDERERLLNEKEENLQARLNPKENFSLALMAGGIVVLFILLMLNYYFDWKRRKTIEAEH
jgi:hypothetical protein